MIKLSPAISAARTRAETRYRSDDRDRVAGFPPAAATCVSEQLMEPTPVLNGHSRDIQVQYMGVTIQVILSIDRTSNPFLIRSEHKMSSDNCSFSAGDAYLLNHVYRTLAPMQLFGFIQ